MGVMSRLLRVTTGAAVAAVAGVLLMGGPAMAGTVSITDNSHVLSQTDVTAITNTGMQLADPVKIYTTTNLANDSAAFDDHYQQKLATSSAHVIIIGINTKSHHLALRTGAKSQVTPTAANTATQAFVAGYKGSQSYSAAIIATLNSLKASISGSHPATGALVHRHPAKKTSMVTVVIALIIGLVILLVVVGILRAIFRGIFGGRRGPRGGYRPGPGYGPNYGPGYGGGYGGGMSPGAAAGLGAAGGAVAGGVLGYELGRMEGEHEAREEYYDRGGYDQGGWDNGGYDQGGGYDYGGGGADADFGGGDSGGGDFGGGGGDW